MNNDSPTYGTLPPRMKEFSRTKLFTAATVPDKLREHHCLPKGTWGLLTVKTGSLVYALEDGSFRSEIKQGESVVIAPETLHRVEPGGQVSFDVAFFKPETT